MASKLQITSSGLLSLRSSSSLRQTIVPLRDRWPSRPGPMRSSSREGILENGFLPRFAASLHQTLTGGRSRQVSLSKTHSKARHNAGKMPDENTRVEHWNTGPRRLALRPRPQLQVRICTWHSVRFSQPVLQRPPRSDASPFPLSLARGASATAAAAENAANPTRHPHPRSRRRRASHLPATAPAHPFRLRGINE